MSDRLQYHVVPDPEAEGQWVIEVKGERSPSFEDKEVAVNTAAALGRDRWESDGQLAQLIIHDRHGVIQEERTYGKDPTPPAG